MESIVYGKIPSKNTVLGKRKPTRIYLDRNHPDKEIQSLASKRGITYKLVDSKELDRLSDGGNHQGVIVVLPPFEYTPIEELLSSVKEKKDSTIVILDGIVDPVNFGSIIRTSNAFGADGIIIMDHRQVGMTPTVSKISTGAENGIMISQVKNLNRAISLLKDNGYWVVCAAGEGDRNYDDIDYSGKIAVVIGSEGDGVSRLVRENSDFICSIPLKGSVIALNASIAAAVFLAQIDSYRRKK